MKKISLLLALTKFVLVGREKLVAVRAAIKVYKQTIRIKPDDAEAHNNLGVAYFVTGDKGSALEEYKILKTLDAELANKLFNLIYK